MMLATPMTKSSRRRIDQIDRLHYMDDLFQGTRLDLEIQSESPRLITMRMVLRGRLVTGETIDNLAEFRFVVPRNEHCGVAESEELEADDPRYPRPPLDPADDILTRRRLSKSMIIKLAARSSEIVVRGGSHFYKFSGLVKRGRQIQCERKEYAYANGF